MTGGDFSQEAYEALREAYANQLTSQDEIEMAGVQVMGQKLGSETFPVDSPWRDKIPAWQYPSGKSAYTDGPQKTPEEVLEVMRAAAAERAAAESESEADDASKIDAMSDEEFDTYVDDLLAKLDEEDEDEDDSDEEDDIDSIVDKILGESEDEVEEEAIEASSDEVDEEFDGVSDDKEIVDEVQEDDAEEAEVPEELDYDPEDIAAEIEAIRAELESLQFTPEATDNDE